MFLIPCRELKEPEVFVVARRVAIGVIGSGAVAVAMLSTGAGSALADPPNCTAADLAGVASGVSAATSAYLFTHPDVNNFFSGLQGKSREEMRTEVKAYMDANPQVRDELTGIRQPLVDIRNRCGAPLGDGIAGGPGN